MSRGGRLGTAGPRWYERLRALARHRSERDEARAYVIDSPLVILEALDVGADVEEVWVEAGTNQAIVDAASARGVPVHPVPPGAITKFKATDLVTPQAAVAVVRMPKPRTAWPAADLVVVLAGVADPGNAGAVMRSAEAAGAGAAVVCDGAVDPYNPKCVRASAGSIVHLEISRGGEPRAVVQEAKASGARTVATVARGGLAPDEVDLTGRVAVVIGSEAHGLADDVVADCDVLVTVPMEGRVESLNAAMAATVVLFEVARQRRSRR